MKIFTKQEKLLLIMTFVLILTSSSLFRLVDETPLEPLLPWYLRFFSVIGFFLSAFVNIPFITVIHLINGKNEVISYDSYFSILPFITALIFTGLIAMIMVIVKQENAKTMK